MNLSSDPVISVIHNSIKRDIRVILQNECWSAAVKLVLSGIDTMAYLNMPDGQQDVTMKDFVEWVEQYIHFPSRRIRGQTKTACCLNRI